jgi:hypothetical protein
MVADVFDLSDKLKQLPLRGQVAFAVYCARRAYPAFSTWIEPEVTPDLRDLVQSAMDYAVAVVIGTASFEPPFYILQIDQRQRPKMTV